MAENYFNPVIASRLASYELRSRRLAEGFKDGQHKSRLIGMSTTFAQHRQYTPGDDPRHLDWKVLAKTDRYYIRQHEAETNLPCLFMLDTSASMFFKSDSAAMSKFDYAATVSATLAYLLFQQKDPFGLILFDEAIRAALPPRSTGGHLRMFFDTLSKAKPAGQTELGKIIVSLGPRMRRRGLVIIISDFLCDLEQLTLGLGQCSFTGQDVLLLLIEDPMERDLTLGGATLLLGSENDGRLLCDPRDYAETYQRELMRHRQMIRDASRRFGFFFDVFPSDGDIGVALGSVLAARSIR